MAVRVGVDVGGTFTKAVAVDAMSNAVVARSSIATTHDHRDGVAAGVVQVIAEVAGEVGASEIQLVTHSTTQAVNALLEGDVATVGVLGLGRAPDLRRAQKRTSVANLELHPGRMLPTIGAFLDVTHGLDVPTATAAVERLQADGAEAIAVAEAFAPDDESNERIVAEIAIAKHLPVTTSTDLSGLYGLELRTVTAALNASILPIAARTAEVVSDGVRAQGIDAPVMVMRGDGGATDLAGFRTAPARTLYSGPAASVAGALRTGPIAEGIILEIGGTSTNVAAIRHGRPALSYVRVASHSTAIRALDVRVVGVAGGSMLRVRRRKVYGVGPRSAHIAGCVYACFIEPGALEGATVELIAPRPGDPADYVVLRLADGRTAAVTNTCAANLLGGVEPGDHAEGSAAAAAVAFALVGVVLKLPAEEVARRMLQASTDHIAALVDAVAKDHELRSPLLLAVGGGAGGLGRAVGRAMQLETMVPPDAEVISAVGDAVSLIRVELERAAVDPTPAEIDALVEQAEEEAVQAGAGVADLDVRVETLPERGSIRVVVSGAVELSTGALPGRIDATPASILAIAAGRVEGAEPRKVGAFWLLAGTGAHVAVLDRYGDAVVDVHGTAIESDGELIAREVDRLIDRHTKRVGPVAIAPDAWVLHGNRTVKLASATAEAVLTAARTFADPAGSIIVIGRS